MILDRNTKFLLAAFTIALLLNGLNPWIQPDTVNAKENMAVSEGGADAKCSPAVSTQSLKGVNDVERLLRYIESSVNDIQLTVKGMDRKMNQIPMFKNIDRR